MNPLITTNNVLQEVLAERIRQDDRWGEQNHPVHDQEDPNGVFLLGRSYAALEQEAKARFAAGRRSWALVELEEIFEALAAKTLAEARAEFIQVAAVAVAAVESIDRKLKEGAASDETKDPCAPGGSCRCPAGAADCARNEREESD